MAFRIVKQPRAWWPISWAGVAEDGTPVENRIEMRFRILKVTEAVAYMADVVEAQAREAESGVDLPAMYAGLVERIADDWKGVHAENDDVLPWTAENLRLLMNEGGMFTHVFNAWRACLAGQPETRAGN